MKGGILIDDKWKKHDFKGDRSCRTNFNLTAGGEEGIGAWKRNFGWSISRSCDHMRTVRLNTYGDLFQKKQKKVTMTTLSDTMREEDRSSLYICAWC